MALHQLGAAQVAVIEETEQGGATLNVTGEPKSGFLSTKWGEEAEAHTIEQRIYSAIDAALG